MFYMLSQVKIQLKLHIYTRPGVASTITETYGPAEVVVDVEAGKEYELTFDREKKMFSYNEKNN